MFFPLLLALLDGEKGTVRAFALPPAAVLIFAVPAAFCVYRRKRPVQFAPSAGFLLVFLAWVFSCLLGAAPFYLSGHCGRLADAVFESVSGFTATGASVFPDVERLPRSLLLWRGMTHWLGGLGMVALAVALFPLLGVGGLHLLEAESSGPGVDRVIPRLTKTAKALWGLYTVLTALQTLLLMLGGMDWFEALCHAFSTMGTGGFSTRNRSIGAFDSPWIDWVCIVFMFLAAFNFTLLYRLVQGKYREVLHNSEARAYGCVMLLAAALIGLAFYLEPGEGASGARLSGPASLEQTLRYACFHAASLLSTTGFSIADHNQWPPLAQGALFFLLFTGGCSGSTAGGVKVIRHVILAKQAGNELKRLLYPRGVFTIYLHRSVGRKQVVYGAAGFVFIYFALILGVFLLISPACPDLFYALNVSLSALGNTGYGLGNLPADFSGLPAYGKWALSGIMIIGRLELWSALVFFSWNYWRR
jgi:trk system potassium uptake protein TrkH